MSLSIHVDQWQLILTWACGLTSVIWLKTKHCFSFYNHTLDCTNSFRRGTYFWPGALTNAKLNDLNTGWQFGKQNISVNVFLSHSIQGCHCKKSQCFLFVCLFVWILSYHHDIMCILKVWQSFGTLFILHSTPAKPVFVHCLHRSFPAWPLLFPLDVTAHSYTFVGSLKPPLACNLQQNPVVLSQRAHLCVKNNRDPTLQCLKNKLYSLPLNLWSVGLGRVS